MLSYILVIGIVAFVATYLFYFYKSYLKNKRLKFLLASLRFMVLLILLLLLFLPDYKKTISIIEKPKLIVAVDNSSSITYLKQAKNVTLILDNLRKSENLRQLFDIIITPFDKDLSPEDSISFDKSQTNIGKSIETAQRIYHNSDDKTTMLLITDGNTTIGSNYAYQNIDYNLTIYPLVVGDTISKVDIKIDNININKYAFKNNLFPVEIFTMYNGEKPVKTKCKVIYQNKELFSKDIIFDKNNRSKVIKTFLEADSIGIRNFKAILQPSKQEANTLNNQKEFAIEVLDKKIDVILVSEISHPDIGALKRSLKDANDYNFKIVKPSIKNIQWKKNIAFILYQPNENFRTIFNNIKSHGKHYFLITGTQTNWAFLNSIQDDISIQENIGGTEAVQPSFNLNYPKFVVKDLSFQGYPPLLSYFGNLTTRVPAEVIFFKSIDNRITDTSLMATIEFEGKRQGYLLGEGLWKWRMKNYLDHQNFKIFDNLFGKMMYYLSQNNDKSRLIVDNKPFYNQGNVEITARYFSKDYVFDNRATLQLTVKTKNSFNESAIMALKNGYYKASFDNAPPGDYTYQVSVKGDSLAKQGQFKILEYNPEKQFLEADIDNLKIIADKTNGKVISSFKNFEKTIISNKDINKPIVKTISQSIHLLDIKWLLIVLAIIFSLEWFLRKRNGLI